MAETNVEQPSNPVQNERILPKVIEEEMKIAYVNYAMSVIVGRALPDVRDGLKPVHRRILYSMYKQGLFSNKPFKKCATVVGFCLGHFHPHGDISVYDALVRMAQDFSLRYPLIKGQGNFGCFTADTKVKLVDGRDLNFLELIEEHKKGKRNFTFTVDNGAIKVAEIKNPRLTKKNAEIMKVILDNKEEIRCTLNHKFMLKDGSYKEAKDLLPKDSLMCELNNNTKVTRVEFIKEFTDVYDLTIDKTHNFALASGIFVHNSIDGDPPAAYRYTESKLNKLAEELLKDIEKNTVNFQENFDGSLKEPTVLPNVLPNLLINGSSGIAVGMATNIPPHNIQEICDGIIAAIDNPEITAEELMSIIPGPDFPTGGEVLCGPSLQTAYKFGRGKVIIKAIATIEDDKIIVTEIPYQVNKEELIEHIASLVHEKTIQGIRNINDESDQEGIRIVIDVKKDADPYIILNQLYQYSRLQTSFGINNLALVNNQPQTLSLPSLIHHHISHRQEVITRRTQFDLQEAQNKVHILEGLLIALNDIDNIITGIKRSPTVEDAKNFLIQSYSLSELQAKAILELRLQKLASLEQEKIRDEHKSLLEAIKHYQEILASESEVLKLIKQELNEIKTNYGDKRRSKIVFDANDVADVDIEQLIEEQTVVVTMTHFGYVKRLPLDTYKTQKRGGKGVKAAGMKDEDFVERIYITSNHDYLLFFTDQGQVHWLKVYTVPEANRQAKGKHIANLLEIPSTEKITAIVPINNFSQGYLFMATRLGTVKKTELQDFANPRKGGIRAINLDENDTLVGVKYTAGNHEIILATKYGNANRFSEQDIRSVGRQASGVRGIRLDANDEVIGMLAAEEGKEILTLTENGYGKRTPVSEYRLCNRGGKGVTNIKITDKNGPVKAVMLVSGNEDLMLISKMGNGIRMKCSDISVVGRATQGVRAIRLEENDQLGAAAIIFSEDENSNGHENITAEIPPPSTPPADEQPSSEPSAPEQPSHEQSSNEQP